MHFSPLPLIRMFKLPISNTRDKTREDTYKWVGKHNTDARKYVWEEREWWRLCWRTWIFPLSFVINSK
jgi:hypothetical protein